MTSSDDELSGKDPGKTDPPKEDSLIRAHARSGKRVVHAVHPHGFGQQGSAVRHDLEAVDLDGVGYLTPQGHPGTVHEHRRRSGDEPDSN